MRKETDAERDERISDEVFRKHMAGVTEEKQKMLVKEAMRVKNLIENYLLYKRNRNG